MKILLILAFIAGICVGFNFAGFFAKELWPVKTQTVIDRLDRGNGVMK